MNVLIAESGPESARMLRLVAEPHAQVKLARLAREAHAWLNRGLDWGAFVFALRLSDGCGLDLLARARTLYPWVPGVLLATERTDQLTRRAAEVNALLLTMDRHVADYLDSALARAQAGAFAEVDPVPIFATAWGQRHRASDCEAAVFNLRVEGLERPEIAVVRGKAESTIRTQERSFCDKTGDGEMHEAVARCLRSGLRERALAAAVAASQRTKQM